MNSRHNWAINTILNHPEEIKLLEGNRPLIQPVYNSAKFTTSEDHPVSAQFIYGRVSNPTTRQLEQIISEIQGREDSIVVSSGIGALTGTFLGLLKSGDHMITYRELYKPARVFIRDFLPKYGITSTILSLKDIALLDEAITSETKLIHFESPTNPNLDIADIEFILKIAKKHNLLVSMDGTFAGLHQHKNFTVDVMIQSLTKFGNGHGDVIAGCISGHSEVIRRIRETSLYIGAHLDPQAAYLIMRGLKTYMIRYEHQSKTALLVAKFLSTHPHVVKVRYPGLENHQGHELAKKQMSHMGAVIAFEIDKCVAESADEFCHKVKVAQMAASVGSTETLICPTLSFFGLDLSTHEREEMGITPYSLRLSIGLEDAQDLINDLNQALRAVEKS